MRYINVNFISALLSLIWSKCMHALWRILHDLGLIAGAASITYGTWLANRTAGFILGGLFLTVGTYLEMTGRGVAGRYSLWWESKSGG
jgi:hypothetical protein